MPVLKFSFLDTSRSEIKAPTRRTKTAMLIKKRTECNLLILQASFSISKSSLHASSKQNETVISLEHSPYKFPAGVLRFAHLCIHCLDLCVGVKQVFSMNEASRLIIALNEWFSNCFYQDSSEWGCC
jgi:hypothetical protein